MLSGGDLHNAWAGDGSQVLRDTARVPERNPHIASLQQPPRRDAGGTTVAFRAVDSVTRPGAPLVEKGRFVVESGRVALLDA